MTGRDTRAPGVFSDLSFVDVRLEDLAGTERQDAARRDLDVVARLRIAPLARPLVAQDEVPESGNLDFFSVLQDRLHRVEYRFDDVLRLLFREAADFLVHDLDQVRLRHSALPFKLVSRGANRAAEPILQ